MRTGPVHYYYWGGGAHIFGLFCQLTNKNKTKQNKNQNLPEFLHLHFFGGGGGGTVPPSPTPMRIPCWALLHKTRLEIKRKSNSNLNIKRSLRSNITSCCKNCYDQTHSYVWFLPPPPLFHRVRGYLCVFSITGHRLSRENWRTLLRAFPYNIHPLFRELFPINPLSREHYDLYSLSSSFFFFSNDRIYSVFLEASIIIQWWTNWYKVNSIYIKPLLWCSRYKKISVMYFNSCITGQQ